MGVYHCSPFGVIVRPHISLFVPGRDYPRNVSIVTLSFRVGRGLFWKWAGSAELCHCLLRTSFVPGGQGGVIPVSLGHAILRSSPFYQGLWVQPPGTGDGGAGIRLHHGSGVEERPAQLL